MKELIKVGMVMTFILLALLVCNNEYSSAGYVINGQAVAVLASYTQKSSNYTLTDKDYTVDCTGTFTLTLPNATTVFTSPGRVYTIKNSGVGTITLATTAGQLIDGATTQTIQSKGGALRGFSSIIVQATGTGWIIISADQP